MMRVTSILILTAALVALAHAQDVTNKYIVVLKPETKQEVFTAKLKASLARENSREGNTVQHSLTHEYNINSNFKGYAAQLSPSYVQTLAKDPAVAKVVPDGVVKALGQEKGAPWGLVRVSQRDRDGSDVYNYPDTAGQGVTAYVIDTGVFTEHPEFAGRASWGKTFCDGCPDKDDNGHGTHCAGTIASNTYGVAKKAKVVAVKVLSGRGSGTYSGVIAGINWVADQVKASGNKLNVASMSLGGPKNDAVNQAVAAAFKAGVNFAIAAGNESQDACNVSPASTEEIVTVAASDSSDVLASFSNHGKCVDVIAPGVQILSTWNDGKTNTISGTSMATPHTAGVIAVILGENPSFTPAQVIAKLKDTATQNKITNLKPDTPNLLIYNQFNGGSKPPTPPQPSPTQTPTSTSTPAPEPPKKCPWWLRWLPWCKDKTQASAEFAEPQPSF